MPWRSRAGQAAEDVSAADHDGNLHAVADDLADLLGQVVNDFWVDAVTQVAR